MSTYAKYLSGLGGGGGGGNIFGSGAANQVAVFSGTYTIGSSSALTFDGTTFSVTGASTVSSSLRVGTTTFISNSFERFSVLFAQTPGSSVNNSAAYIKNEITGDSPLVGVSNGLTGILSRVITTSTTDTNALRGVTAGIELTVPTGQVYTNTSTTNPNGALRVNPPTITGGGTSSITRLPGLVFGGNTFSGATYKSHIRFSTISGATNNAFICDSDIAGDWFINYSGSFPNDLGAGLTTVAAFTASGDTTFSALTATTVPYLNASKVLTSSAVTPTELGYVSGVTSAIQTQLNAKAPTASPTFTGTVTLPSGSVTSSAWSFGSSTFGGSGAVSLTGTTDSSGAATGILQVSGGASFAKNVYHATCIGIGAAEIVTYVNGDNKTVSNNTAVHIMNISGTIATATTTLPSSPMDGQLVCITSLGVVTTMTISPNSGQSVAQPTNSMSTVAACMYYYRLSNTTWYRLR